MSLSLDPRQIRVAEGAVSDDFAALPAGILDAAGTRRLMGVVLYVYDGAVLDIRRDPTIFKPVSAVVLPLTTDTAIWTPAAGKRFRLMGFLLAFTVAATITIKDGAAGATIWTLIAQPINTNIPSPPALGNGIRSGAADRALTFNASAASNVSGIVFGTEE